MAASTEQVNNDAQQSYTDALCQVAPSTGPVIITTTRGYELNIDRTLKAKLDACKTVEVNYEIKRGGITGTLDTANFELLRAACTSFYKSMRTEEGRCVINISEDKKRKAVVQQTYKFTRSCENDATGYTLNLYPTRNSLLLNGKDTDTFIDAHLPAIHALMCQTARDWEVSSAETLNHILSEQFKHILESRQLKKSETQTGPQPSTLKNTLPYASTSPKPSSGLNGNAQPFLPSADLPPTSPPVSPHLSQDTQGDIKCLKCRRNCMGRSAYCETGGHWIHYYCDRLTKEEEKRLHTDQGFIYVCKSCRAKSENTDLKTVHGKQTLKLPRISCPDLEKTVENTTAESLLKEEEYQTCFVCHENMGQENCCDLCSGPCHQRCMYINPNGETTDICKNCAQTQHQDNLQLAGTRDESLSEQQMTSLDNTQGAKAVEMVQNSLTPQQVPHNLEAIPGQSQDTPFDISQASQGQTDNLNSISNTKAPSRQVKKKDMDTTVKLRELRQMETKLRKWEDELKQRESRLSNYEVDYKRMEDYLQKTEARNLELESTVRTLQRRISVLEQNPGPSQNQVHMNAAPSFPTMKVPQDAMREDNRTNNLNHGVPHATTPRDPHSSHTTTRDPHSSLIKGLHQQVTGFILRKVAKQITDMELLDTELEQARAYITGQRNVSNNLQTGLYQNATEPLIHYSHIQSHQKCNPVFNTSWNTPQNGPIAMSQHSTADAQSQPRDPGYPQMEQQTCMPTTNKLQDLLQGQWRQNAFTLAEVESGHPINQPHNSNQNRPRYMSDNEGRYGSKPMHSSAPRSSTNVRRNDKPTTSHRQHTRRDQANNHHRRRPEISLEGFLQ